MPLVSNIDSSLKSEATSDEQGIGSSSYPPGLKAYLNRVVDLEKKISETEKKIEQSKDKNIETLGLFVALFTFISVEFSLLNGVKDFAIAISLTLTLAGLLILFTLLLHIVVRFSSNDGRGWMAFYILLFVISIGLVSVGILFPYSVIGKNLSTPTPTPTPVASPSATIKSVPAS